eukprot:SAG22_NODE_307_length_12666_cov_761.250259_6_plen_94_part_00
MPLTQTCTETLKLSFKGSGFLRLVVAIAMLSRASRLFIPSSGGKTFSAHATNTPSCAIMSSLVSTASSTSRNGLTCQSLKISCEYWLQFSFHS